MDINSKYCSRIIEISLFQLFAYSNNKQHNIHIFRDCKIANLNLKLPDKHAPVNLAIELVKSWFFIRIFRGK